MKFLTKNAREYASIARLSRFILISHVNALAMGASRGTNHAKVAREAPAPKYTNKEDQCLSYNKTASVLLLLIRRFSGR